MRYLYDAKLVPIGQPVNLHDEHGRPDFYTFDEKSFEIERTRPSNVNVCLKHDRSKRIGKLTNLIPFRGWWICDFTIDPALRSELRVGQPVSVGLVSLSVGSGVPILSEVSIVRKGAVEGACITSRHELKPSTPRSKPSPAARKPTPAAGEVILHRTPAPVEDPFMVELQRRMDWAERRTGRPANMEDVLNGMRRELHGPSLDEVYAAHRAQRAAA
jgi:hypothetical protein